MQSLLSVLLGLLLSVSVRAEPLFEGRVRLSDGLPVAGAQVLLFELAELRQGAVAQATTDADGQFRLARPSVEGRARPEGFALGPNYPNPFNPATIIPYQLSASAAVRLEVFNLLGQRIATLVDAEQSAGAYTVLWDATDADGQAVGAGVYIYRLTVGGAYQTGRMVLLDGQAGVPTASGSVGSGPAAVAVEREYGLAVMGSGVAYVDPAFRVVAGMAPVDLVVEPVDSWPRAKVAASRILGDVDNDGQVTASDVVYIVLYSRDSSVVLPNGGDISLGDVNADGAVNGTDAWLLARFIHDPTETSLPPGIGQAVPEASGDSGEGEALLPMPAVRLTHNELFFETAPAWSPDGQRIAFTSLHDGGHEIFVMNADGSGVTQLTHDTDGFNLFPAWSPDGRIAFSSTRDGDYEIFVMNADGSGVTQLTHNELFFESGPAWSPDGQRIAFISDRDGDFEIFVMNADGSGLTQLTHNDDFDDFPAWSPDGRRIAFNSHRHGGREIFVMNADGSGLTQLTHKDDWDAGSDFLAYDRLRYVIQGSVGPAWSPDGRRIAFAFPDRDGDGEVYVMNADGSGLTQLTDNRDEENFPAWSPDGQRIAFNSTRHGGREIYVINVAGEPVPTTPRSDSPVQLTHNDDRDWDPAWSPDGQRIAFASTRDGDREIYVMNADGSGLTQLTHNDDWDAGPAWSPDGQRIAFASTRDGWDFEIYVMNADGSGLTQLTDNSDEDSVPAWSPDGRIAFNSDRDGDYEIFVMNADGSGLTQLTHNGGFDIFPAWSPDGRRIAFHSDRDGDDEIYVMNADGSGLTQLTHNDGFEDEGPAWSPDGRIAFASNRDGRSAWDFEIYVMNADGSGLTQLTDHDAENSGPAWSPDGQRIAFTSNRDGDYEIYVMNVAGEPVSPPPRGGLTQLTHNDDNDNSPAWSPDSQRIAFASNREWVWVSPDSVWVQYFEIYVMNADGSGVTRLTHSDGGDIGGGNYSPAWSPDGQRIAFTSNRDDGEDSEIFVMNADGSGLTQLTDNDHPVYEPAWSPDGQRIAFGHRDGDTEIFVMNADGSGLTQLTDNDHPDWHPTWSPDGRRIAFTSYLDGVGEIYVMNADGAGLTQLTHNDDWDAGAAWSPDGRRIAFYSDRDGDDGDDAVSIYVMNADGSGVTQLTDHDAENYGPAWSPDGRRIAFYSDRDGDSDWDPEIYVMNVDGSAVTQLTNNPDADLPAWSLGGRPSAHRIRLRSRDGDAETIDWGHLRDKRLGRTRSHTGRR